MSEHDEIRKEKSEKIVEDFGRLCNDFCREPKFFIEAFCREHRTLQQSMFGVIVALIGHMASSDYHTDGRNKYSQKVAKAFLKGLRDMYEERERSYYERNGYTPEQVEEKLVAFRKNFDADPKLYLKLPCV